MKALASIIQSSIDKIEEVLTANAFVLPSSNTPFSLESEAPRMHPNIQSAGLLITSAAAQLVTLVGPAQLVIAEVMTQVNRIVPASVAHVINNTSVIKFHASTAMRTAVSTHVAEILRDAGPKVKPGILSAESSHWTSCLLRVYTHEKSPNLRGLILGSFVCIGIVEILCSLIVCHQLGSYASLQQITYSWKYCQMCSPITAYPPFWTPANLLKS